VAEQGERRLTTILAADVAEYSWPTAYGTGRAAQDGDRGQRGERAGLVGPHHRSGVAARFVRRDR